MSAITKVHDVVCQGCGGKSGAHMDVRCPFLLLALGRVVKRK